MSAGKVKGLVPGAQDGVRSASGSASGAAFEIKRWSANRKKEVVLRLLRGESVDALSREVGVEIYRLEQWREQGLSALDAGLRERGGDPLVRRLDEANRRIGELVMEVEILKKAREVQSRPLVGRRSSR